MDWDADKDRLVLTSGCATMSDIVGLLTVDGVNNGPVYHFSQVRRVKEADVDDVVLSFYIAGGTKTKTIPQPTVTDILVQQ